MLYTSAYFHLHISNKSACVHVYISSYISNISAWTTRSGTRLSPSCTLLSRSRCVVGSFQYQVLDCFRPQGMLLVLFNIKCLIVFLYKVDGHGQMQTTVLPHVSRWDHSWLIILLVEVFPWSNRNNLKLQPRMEWDFGKHQPRKWKQGGRKYWTKKFLPKICWSRLLSLWSTRWLGGKLRFWPEPLFRFRTWWRLAGGSTWPVGWKYALLGLFNID